LIIFLNKFLKSLPLKLNAGRTRILEEFLETSKNVQDVELQLVSFAINLTYQILIVIYFKLSENS